jgi:GT2 family glycosyltransferase
MSYRIEAATVNHNTSSYAELMLRSLFATHSPDLDLSVTVFDNASEDDAAGLRAYAEEMGVPIVQSGFTTQTQNNSHGEILRRFVLEHPDCTHYLFLDADVCFVQDDTIGVMLEELEKAGDAFGIGPRLSWDGVTELSEEALRNPDLYEARLHPCCALVKNTGLFRRVVEEVGLSCVKYLWAEREEYLDTFKLMTKVIKTHGLRHLISSRMVVHFFCVSYEWDPPRLMQEKGQRRDALLAELRG